MKFLLYLLLSFLLSINMFSQEDKGPAWSVLCRGKDSRFDERKTEIFRNTKAYEKAWQQLRKTDMRLPEIPPKIDFKKKTVIAFYAGSQTNGLEADSLWISKNELMVRLTRLEMEPTCHEAKLLVTPYVWIETDRVGWLVLKTAERIRTMDCK
jgi:hypothetical protein